MRWRFGLLFCLLPCASLADTAADKDFLTSWLETNLSGAGRVVTIDGFQGALSSQASLKQMTIADDSGVWLTLKDVKLDWSRSALLSGQIEISELSAGEIDLERMPQGQPAPSLPSAEATPLKLPELPVSITIKGIAADRIVLGPSVLGQPVEGSLSADLTLAGGEGAAHLNLQRSDAGPEGHVTLSAGFSNATDVLDLSLDAAEGAGGIAASLLHVPGAPASSLTIQGKGPLSKFAATVNLSTDGQTRLAGQVSLADDAQGNRSFAADLSGDPTPVFLPDYARFFGPNLALKLKGTRQSDGALAVDDLTLQAQAMNLHGAMAFGANGQPQRLNLVGTVGLGADPVTLPVASSTPIRLHQADLKLNYDASRSDVWTFDATVSGLDSGSLTAGLLRLSAEGRLQERLFDGTASFTASALQPKDDALAAALGSTIKGSADFSWNSATSGFQIGNLALEAPGYAISTKGQIGQLASLNGSVAGHYDDLSRLSGLAGRPLSGAARFELAGSADPLTGAFDLKGDVLGSGLTVGVAELDHLLTGESRVDISARRDQGGTVLRQLTLTAGALSADLTGKIASAGADLSGQLSFPDLSALGSGYGGSLTADAAFTGTFEAGSLTATAQGQDLSIGQAQADKILRGKSALTTRLVLTPQGMQIDTARIETPELTASATGTVSGAARDLTISARMANLGLLYPEFPGALAITGTARQDAAGTALDLAAKGPGQIDARINGSVSADLSQADLAISGTATAALANALIAPRSTSGALRFDLRLNGPLALSSLSGPVSISGGRLADPAQTFGLQDLNATARLGGARAQITGKASVTTGGSISLSGSVGMTAPYQADLTVLLGGVGLKDPQLYSTTADGSVTFRGPALGGATIAGDVALGRTELRIPSTGFGADGNMPGLQHRNEPAAVKATRVRAGLGAARTSGAAGPAYGLAVRISAPNQVFVRGRGLDAELGGSLVLGGTTANIAPSGAFNLLRGRLDILGRRLVLSEAQLQMQGALVPYVHIVASVESDGVTSSVVVDGDATDPTVTFTSTPDLPQEEVIARLLFNRGLENISAFQAVQLAGAVATLAGKGGEGVAGAIRSKSGLDNLDVQADATGNTSVTAGKYLSDKTYSEVTVDQSGKSSISLNYDISRHITLKLRMDSENATGAGVFLKRDY